MSGKQERAKSDSKQGKKGLKTKTSINKGEEHLRKKLKEAKQELEITKDQLLRTVAELDNYRKRTEREIAQLILNANSGIVKDLLPVIDDFERSLDAISKQEDSPEYRKGIELIYQKLISILRNYGLEAMESLNFPFDVEKHDALLQVKKDGVEAGLVVEEHEKGYYFKDKVLRHAKVVVSK